MKLDNWQVFWYSRIVAMLLDAIREAIEASGQSRYAIAKATGVSESALSRLMSGERGLSVDSLETLAEYLGLEIVVRQRARRKAK